MRRSLGAIGSVGAAELEGDGLDVGEALMKRRRRGQRVQAILTNLRAGAAFRLMGTCTVRLLYIVYLARCQQPASEECRAAGTQ